MSFESDSKSRWRGGAYRGYRGGYRGYRGGYRGYRGGYRGYRGVRAYGYRYGYRPYRRYGAVGAVAGYGGCGPYSYYDSYSGVCRPSGGYYGARGVYRARVYRGRGYAYRGYRGGYRGGVYRGRAAAVRGGYVNSLVTHSTLALALIEAAQIDAAVHG